MEIARLILEFLRVILSAPVIAGIVALGFFYLFAKEIRSLLDRIATIKWGSAELSAPQLPATQEVTNGRQLPSTAPDPQVPALTAGLTVGAEERHRLEQAFLAERASARLWEYRYLNLFFVHNTQRVLDWFASLPHATTYTMFDAIWQPLIPNAEQRRTIVQVLEGSSLILYRGEVIEVTAKGREYIQWRGPLNLVGTPPVVAERS